MFAPSIASHALLSCRLTSPTRLDPWSFFSKRIIMRAKRAMISPWPASPNMTAKRKGKVMTV